MNTIKMKTILIALDYDVTAQKVAETGCLLAENMNAEIILLHIVADVTYYTELEYSQIKGLMGLTHSESSHLFDHGLKNAMKHFLEHSKLQLGDHTIQTLVKEGDFAETILNTAKELKAAIIVMGSHSRRWLDDILLGSVTEKVLQNSAIPLFIVPIKRHK